MSSGPPHATAAGVPDAHFHDLRHTGGTLAATTGATTKELMARLGHSSTRAAMVYQHATRDRDKAIADALGQLAGKARERTRSGPQWPGPLAAIEAFETLICLRERATVIETA